MDLKLFTYEQNRNFLIKNEKKTHLRYETKLKDKITTKRGCKFFKWQTMNKQLWTMKSNVYCANGNDKNIYL